MASLQSLLPSDPTFRHAILTSLAAGALGFVGSLATVLVTWANNSNTFAKKTREVDLAQKRMSFWENWLKITTGFVEDSELSQLRNVATYHILKTARMLEFSFQDHDREVQEKREVALWSSGIDKLALWRRALLLYRPRSVWFRYFRVVFYLYVILLLIVTISKPHMNTTGAECFCRA